MSWHIPDPMIQRLEFVSLAKQPGVNFRRLCARFGISARIGCKWLHRFERGGFAALRDRSRRPQRSPQQCAASTCTAILHRAGVFAQRSEPPARPLQRFRRDSPNALVQLDFKGDFALQDGRRCYPLAAIDDHSRFNLLLEASPNQTGASVRLALTRAFERYGLPEELLCDNGPRGAGASRPAPTPRSRFGCSNSVCG